MNLIGEGSNYGQIVTYEFSGFVTIRPYLPYYRYGQIVTNYYIQIITLDRDEISSELRTECHSENSNC